MSTEKESVTVRIAGEEHTIRSSAQADYTKRCARHVDQRIHDIKKQVGLLEGHRAAILAALSITDELFQAKDDLERSGIDLVSRMEELAERLEAAIAHE